MCVNRGNEPKLPETATQITYILGTIFSSLLFTIFLGSWLAIFTLVVLNGKHKRDFKDDKSSLAMIEAVKWVSVAMGGVELVLFVIVISLSAIGNASWFIYAAPVTLLFVGLIIGTRFNEDTLVKGNEDTVVEGNEDTLGSGNTRGSENLRLEKENKFCCKHMTRLQIISTFIWAFLTSYHISWLVVGIMVNAIWGITVLFFFCLIIVVSFFITYSCFKSRPWFVTFLFISLSFVAMVIFAGPPGFGSSTADDVVKIVIVPIATGIIPLIYHLFLDKKENGKSKEKEDVAEEREEQV